MSLDLYDRHGAAVAYSDDGTHFFSYAGEPIAYLAGESVYSFTGAHLGTFRGGWLRDHDGAAVLFAEGATGGPVKPIRQIKPIRSIRSLMPIKGIREIPPIGAIPSYGWSSRSIRAFFSH